MPEGQRAAPGKDIGLILAVLRTVRRRTQAQLASQAGIKRGLISNYERGETIPDLCTLERLLEALGFGFSAIDRTRNFLQSILPGLFPEGKAETATRRPNAEIVSLAVETVGKITEQTLRILLEDRGSQTEDLSTYRSPTSRSPSPADRAEAAMLWERLKRHPLKVQQALASEASEFKHWALCELLCRESEKAAAGSADQAIALAELAVTVAEELVEPAAQGGRVAAYAYAHLGNALRVKGDLPASRKAFLRFDSLWSTSDGLPCLLEEARALDMKASLLRAERRSEEALAVLDRAFAAD